MNLGVSWSRRSGQEPIDRAFERELRDAIRRHGSTEIQCESCDSEQPPFLFEDFVRHLETEHYVESVGALELAIADAKVVEARRSGKRAEPAGSGPASEPTDQKRPWKRRSNKKPLGFEIKDDFTSLGQRYQRVIFIDIFEIPSYGPHTKLGLAVLSSGDFQKIVSKGLEEFASVVQTFSVGGMHVPEQPAIQEGFLQWLKKIFSGSRNDQEEQAGALELDSSRAKEICDLFSEETVAIGHGMPKQLELLQATLTRVAHRKPAWNHLQAYICTKNRLGEYRQARPPGVSRLSDRFNRNTGNGGDHDTAACVQSLVEMTIALARAEQEEWWTRGQV